MMQSAFRGSVCQKKRRLLQVFHCFVENHRHVYEQFKVFARNVQTTQKNKDIERRKLEFLP